MCMNAALPVTVCWNGTEDPLIPVLATNVSVEFVHSVKSLCFEFRLGIVWAYLKLGCVRVDTHSLCRCLWCELKLLISGMVS
jgi:hypothetical protein